MSTRPKDRATRTMILDLGGKHSAWLTHRDIFDLTAAYGPTIFDEPNRWAPQIIVMALRRGGFKGADEDVLDDAPGESPIDQFLYCVEAAEMIVLNTFPEKKRAEGIVALRKKQTARKEFGTGTPSSEPPHPSESSPSNSGESPPSSSGSSQPSEPVESASSAT